MTDGATILTAIVTGAGLGWLSIPHCFGMCGALHLSVSCINSEHPVRSLTTFNLGRLVGYTILGLIAGGAGLLINKAGGSCCSQAASRPVFAALIPAVCFLALGVGALRKKGVTGSVSPLLGRLLGKTGLFTSGCAASLLPCGVLYAALAAAVGTGDLLAGGALMLVYCFTITVVMELVLLAGHGIHHSFKERLSALLPYIFLVLAALYFVRFFAKL